MVTRKPPADSPEASSGSLDDSTVQPDTVPEALPASRHAAAAESENAAAVPPPPVAPAAPVVVEPVVVEPLVVEAVVEAVVVEAALPDPSPAPESAPPPAAPARQVIYVQRPVPPRKLGNRGVGSVFAILGALLYGVLLAGAAWLLQASVLGTTGFDFLATWDFYVPIIVFAIAFVLLVLLANRAGWGAYVFGSLIVGGVVFAGTIGVELLLNWLIWQQVDSFAVFAASSFHIVAAVLAREVAVWFGWIVARRGKRVTARNRDAQAAFDAELAEFHATMY